MGPWPRPRTPLASGHLRLNQNSIGVCHCSGSLGRLGPHVAVKWQRGKEGPEAATDKGQQEPLDPVVGPGMAEVAEATVEVKAMTFTHRLRPYIPGSTITSIKVCLW